MRATRQGRGAAIAAALVLAVIWGGGTAHLFTTGSDEGITAIAIMAIFGLALSGLAWLLTLGAKAPPIEVRRPALESGVLLIYLAVVYAGLFLVYGMGGARAAFPPGPQQEMLVLALKLAVHVILPMLLLALLGARLAPLWQAGVRRWQFWLTLMVLGAIILGLLCVVSPSLANIAATHTPWSTLAWIAPVSFIWIAIEAGLNEEFLFRAVLQTRLTAWFNSAWAGVFVTSLIFGVAHAPGLFMRGGPGVDGWSTDPGQVVAYTFAVLAPMGLLFGLIYARTKSLLLVVLLHASVDVLPNLAEFIETWT